MEFATYALQNEDFRQELLTRFATLRSRFATIFEHRMETYGIDAPVPVDRIVRMVIRDGRRLGALAACSSRRRWTTSCSSR